MTLGLFENELRSHLRDQLHPIGSNLQAPSPKLAAGLQSFLEDQALWWRIQDLIDSVAKSVDDESTRGNVKLIKNFRDYVAHRTSPAPPVVPAQAFQHLAAFLWQVNAPS